MKLRALLVHALLICGTLLQFVPRNLTQAAAEPPQPPDLTRGGQPNKYHDWTLGPTGARGWIWSRDLETTEARQILITKVEKGSPADGVLAIGDVILGVDGTPFARDPRRVFGEAIGEAEREQNKGVLKVLRWRAGSQGEVTLQLAVLGDYRSTAPYDCPKSQRILEAGCRHLAQHGLGGRVLGEINALALLASGKPEYLEVVKAYARKIGPANLKLKYDGMASWHWGYANLLLTEYYLATGDDYVLPAIREYTVQIARGQSAVGTWGHGMALPTEDGRLGGYGALNQAGLVCWMSLALAEKCGVRDQVVQAAVDKAAAFFAFFAGKGSVPYGDHPPYWEYHDNNGKSSMAAVGFDLLGKTPEARFFSWMSTAAYDEREAGHTGNFFSLMWGPLGVARAGPEAVAASFKEQRWYYDLARRWDGGFTYQGGAGGHDSYADWDMTGAMMLGLALPLQKLQITGKGAQPAQLLVGRELQSVIEDGRDFSYRHVRDCYASRTVDQLLAGLSSWSPAVRFRSASGLARKRTDCVAQLLPLLQSNRLETRYGACQALEYLQERGAPAVDLLIDQLEHRDVWLRIRAAYALAGIGKPARRAAPALLKLALQDDPNDRLQMTRRYMCFALFLNSYMDDGPRRGLLSDSIEGVDRDVLLPAFQRMLAVEDGMARWALSSLYAKLSEEELNRLWPDILRAVERPARSGEMFADEIRLAGLKLLADRHIQEGIAVSVRYARNQNPWASETRMENIMAALKSYGSAAKETLPQLRELLEFCQNEQDFPADCKKRKCAAVADAIQAIEAAREHPRLRSIRASLGAPPPR
jgi:hypothetical protein